MSSLNRVLVGPTRGCWDAPMAAAGGMRRGVSHVDAVQAGIVSHDSDREPEELRLHDVSGRLDQALCGTVWFRRWRGRVWRGVQPAARRQPHTMLWVRACQTAMLRTLSRPRTTNCRSPRLRAWALEHSAVAARSL